MQKTRLVLLLALLLTATLAVSASAATNTRADLIDGSRTGQVKSFNIGPYAPEVREAYIGQQAEKPAVGQPARRPKPIGSALSPYTGLGPGASVDLTFDDVQWTWGRGRFTAAYYNGLSGGDAIVDVHFAYRENTDTFAQGDAGWIAFDQSAYNVYDAVNGDWPQGENTGCELQSLDTLGRGYMPSMDLLEDGRVVLASESYIFGDTLVDGTRYEESKFFFQQGQYGCLYTDVLNTRQIDSVNYQPYWISQADGVQSRDPQVVTQWDGTQTVTHVLMGEDSGGNLMTGPRFDDTGNDTYFAYVYFRGVGSTAGTHTWQLDETQIIDTIHFVWTSLVAAPYPHQGVAVIYTNTGYWGGLLENNNDNDIYYRESTDRGLNWGAVTNITNYQNAVANDPAHFTAWLEAEGLYSSDGNLHAIWVARPTSTDPYFDGYNWSDFDENLYHWDQNSGDITKIANGVFYNDDMLTGSPNTIHCGFIGSNIGYLGFAQLSECDGKLYVLWSQIHERMNHGDWREDETLIDDCSLNGARLAKANSEILMSVAQMATPTLWDPARNLTNTYTPNCCYIGEVDEDCVSAPCGSEWKPMPEKYGLDYAGLSLTWPDNMLDMTPAGDPPYAGTHFLNVSYVDDQYPGPYAWGRTNPPGTENEIKWVRLACVEPVEASLIRIGPTRIEFPEWVQSGTSDNFTVTVTNEGNVTLHVTEITDVELAGPSGWLSASAGSLNVTAGVDNTNTFDIIVNAPSGSTPSWLDGTVYLRSDAQNFDSVAVQLHVLAAPHVEPAVWDTVYTHIGMYDPYGVPEGECIGLAVSNMGEMGRASATNVNLDFTQSGRECGTRARDQFYLASSTPFVLDADAGGLNVVGTNATFDLSQANIDSWDPYDAAATPTPGADITDELDPSGDFQVVHVGKTINRDSTIIWESWFYGPRDNVNNNSFIVMKHKVYSADGQPHANLALGTATDWDIPAENPPNNTAAVSTAGGFTYAQGTDTTGVLSCQLSTARLGAEAFGGWGINNDDPCQFSTEIWGSAAFNQLLMADTDLTRLGEPLDPQMPDYQAWWDDIRDNPGFNGSSTVEDQAIWTTYLFDYDLAAADTLYFWSVLSTVRNGAAAQLENQVTYARNWYKGTVLGCVVGCCSGKVGDANGLGGDDPTIGDISLMIDALFITAAQTPLVTLPACMDEADVNLSALGTAGGNIPHWPPVYEDITIGDVSALIDALYIRADLGLLNLCP